jgi:hypothetical protein
MSWAWPELFLTVTLGVVLALTALFLLAVGSWSWALVVIIALLFTIYLCAKVMQEWREWT